MKHASIVFRRHRSNSIFEGNEGANFGGWYFPFNRLREGMRDAGIELSTADMNTGRDVLFELHINVQRRQVSAPMYCYDYEHPPRARHQRQGHDAGAIPAGLHLE